MTADEIKTMVDVGLGAVSLLLWLRQGKVNKQQVTLDQAQNKAMQDLTTMVKDHEGRIGLLEETSVHRKRSKRR